MQVMYPGLRLKKITRGDKTHCEVYFNLSAEKHRLTLARLSIYYFRVNSREL